MYDRERNASNIDDDGSQTQPETQFVANVGARTKRKSREEQDSRSKRVKISLGDAMDLGD